MHQFSWWVNRALVPVWCPGSCVCLLIVTDTDDEKDQMERDVRQPGICMWGWLTTHFISHLNNSHLQLRAARGEIPLDLQRARDIAMGEAQRPSMLLWFFKLEEKGANRVMAKCGLMALTTNKSCLLEEKHTVQWCTLRAGLWRRNEGGSLVRAL